MMLNWITPARKRWLAAVIIAAPWIAKEYVAANLDRATRNADRALTELDNQTQRHRQDKDQRDMQANVVRINAAVQLLIGAKDRADYDKGTAEEFVNGTTEDAKSMERRADAFLKLVKSTGITPVLETGEREALIGLGEKAKKSAAGLVELDFLKPLSSREAKAFEASYQTAITKFNDAEAELDNAYVGLSEYTEAHRDKTETLAELWRKIAWALTAIGAALMGDWRKVVQTATGSDEEEPATPA